MECQVLEIEARDGYKLSATLYSPGLPSGDVATTIIINSAVAVRRRFYDRFARYLCAHGFRVLTYDYRGIGDSLHEPIKAFRCEVLDWGRLDLAGVVDAVAQRYPDGVIILAGHSIGGQLLGLADNCQKIKAMLSIASQSGYWRLWPVPARYVMAGFWYVLLPAFTAVCGYFPAKKLNLGENLPAGIARQWTQWCRRPTYMIDEVAVHQSDFARFQGDILAVSFDDDFIAPDKAVVALHSLYSGASVEHRRVVTRDVAAGRVGHFGFFRKQAESELWEPLLPWLRSI